MCALGDSSHFDFCGAGRKVDEKFQELGAKKILDRHELREKIRKDLKNFA